MGDVDGEDIWLFASLKRFRPRAVVVEYAPTYALSVHAVHNPLRGTRSSSIGAMREVGNQKGYELVHVNGVNAFFVRIDVLSSISNSFLDAGNISALCSRPRSVYSFHREWASGGRCGISRTSDGAIERKSANVAMR